MSPKGRQAKGKARINAYEALLDQDSEQQDRALEIYIPPGPRLGDKVLTFKGVSKGFQIGGNGQFLNLVENCSFNLPRGGIVGVIGPNGTGKTTLLRMIIGQEKPDRGTIEGLKAITLDDVKAFHHKHYTLEALTLGMAGGFGTTDPNSVQSGLVPLPRQGLEIPLLEAPRGW